MHKIRINVLVALLATLPCESLFAVGSGGISNQAGISQRATALGISFAGVADDPSAAYFNPAGLTRVKGLGLEYGATLVALSSEHTDPTGRKDSLAGNDPVVPDVYATYSQEGCPFAFGLGINSPFGLVTEWKDDSFSRFYATESKILMYQINPSVAYAVNEKVSVAAGIDYVNIFDAELNQQVLNLDFSFSPLSNAGHGKFSGNGTGWGYNTAIHIKASDRHAFGLAYRSQINVIVKGETELTGLEQLTAFAFGGPSYRTDSRTELKLPQSVLFGYGFRPNEKVTIFADYEWVDWHSTKETKFDYSQNNASLTQSIPRKWRDTSNVGFGVEWKACKMLDLRFGALAYEAAIPDATLDSAVPDTGRFALSFGPGLRFGNSRMDISYMAVFLQNKTINNNAGNASASMDGKFESMINVFGVGVSHRWGAAKS
jgi:long-chain fatty acid transport protein